MRVSLEIGDYLKDKLAISDGTAGFLAEDILTIIENRAKKMKFTEAAKIAGVEGYIKVLLHGDE